MSKRIILTRWIGRTTEYGPEFVIGVGDSVAGSKHIHKIVRGNEVQGVRFETPIKVGEISSSQKLDCGSIGMMNGVLVYYDGKDYREILVGDKVEEPE